MNFASDEFRLLLADMFDDYTEIECPDEISIDSVSIVTIINETNNDSDWN